MIWERWRRLLVPGLSENLFWQTCSGKSVHAHREVSMVWGGLATSWPAAGGLNPLEELCMHTENSAMCREVWQHRHASAHAWACSCTHTEVKCGRVWLHCGVLVLKLHRVEGPHSALSKMGWMLMKGCCYWLEASDHLSSAEGRVAARCDLAALT